jgi:PAS domain S-box-containing protein
MSSEILPVTPKPDRLLTTLQRLLELSTTDMAETLHKTSQLVTQALGAEKVDVFLYDPESRSLVAVGTSVTPMGNKEKAIGLDRLPLASGGRVVEVYLTGQSYWTGQAHRDPHELPGMKEELGIKSEMVVPLEVSAERRGVLFASSSRPDFLTEQDLRFLEAVSHWVGVVIHRAELVEQRTKEESERAENALRHLAAIVSSSSDAIIGKDLSGTIISCNAAAERMYGYSERQMVGQPITLLFPPDRQGEYTQIMERISRGERVEHFETIRMRKDGSLVPVSVTISPVRNHRGVIIGASSIARDISERIELERQHVASVSLVSHELKSLLTVLQGSMQLIQRRLTRMLSQAEELPDKQQWLLEDTITLLEQTHQPLQLQQRLINDLLDLAHILQDKVKLQLTVFDLIRLVNETVRDYRTAYPDRLITLDLPEPDAIAVYADRDRVQQVLSNYLTNALKFAPVTEPIQIGIVREEAKVRVWVQDRGPGLTKEQQANIWQRLYQVSHTPVQSGFQEGLGIGLYLCRQLIQRQQGSVGVESIPGEGATFWFTLPVSEKSETHD